MTHGITYTDESMTQSAKLCVESMLRNNVHTATIMQRKDIHPIFISSYAEEILSSERGAGYWLWKSMIIMQELSRLKDGAVLMYCDAGVEVINNINYLVERIPAEDVMLFGNGHKHLTWCKMDIMKAILPEDWNHPDWIKFDQVQASVIIVRKSERSFDFIKQWFHWCLHKNLIDDSPSVTPNHPSFKENRHDQAILGTLKYKYGIPLHWWPAQYPPNNFVFPKGWHIEDYPVIFSHHYRRNPGMGKGRPEWD